MRGMADGPGVDFEDIPTLNARSEVLMPMKVGAEREMRSMRLEDSQTPVPQTT